MRRLQPLNVEDPLFRIHNLGEMMPTVKRPTADHSPLYLTELAVPLGYTTQHIKMQARSVRLFSFIL
jgi:hypothetical protein